MGADQTEEGSVGRPMIHAVGILGVFCLAYSAGYTRGMIVERGRVIGRPASAVNIFSIGDLPVWIGVMGFVGVAVTFLYLLYLAYLTAGRIGSTPVGTREE